MPGTPVTSGMEIFLDSANVKEIQRWLDEGIVDGVTTNPSIMLADGVHDVERGAVQIAELVHPRPVSVEVTTNDRDEMLRQGRALARLGPNIVVKIPVINQFGEPCLRIVRALEGEGIRVNVTACLSFGQAAMAAKVGATYVSLFTGRISDEGNDAGAVVRMTAEWLARWGYKSRIIVGSIRQVYNIQEAAVAGAHVITVPPQFMQKLVDHKYSRDTVRGFVEDGQRALSKMGAART
ncbi:MAG TPA: transaldolase family protein [bacterium]|nr:transaldolase family protein [bacterium]